jgi:aminopeptidase N
MGSLRMRLPVSAKIALQTAGVIGALILHAAPTAAQTTAPAPGVSRDLAEQRAQLVSDLRYDLSMSIPASRAEPITGTTLIRFHLANTKLPLVLDFDPGPTPTISSEVNGRAWPAEPVNGHLVISPTLLRQP